jgi:hypothetical protein
VCVKWCRFSVRRILAKSLGRRHPDMGPDNPARGPDNPPSLRDRRNLAKDLDRRHPDMGPDKPARGADNPPPCEISEKQLRTQLGVTHIWGWIIRPGPG